MLVFLYKSLLNIVIDGYYDIKLHFYANDNHFYIHHADLNNAVALQKLNQCLHDDKMSNDSQLHLRKISLYCTIADHVELNADLGRLRDLANIQET